MGELLTLDALGPGGAYRSRDRRPVRDVCGTPVAETALVPSLYVARTVAALRRAGPLPVDLRARALRAAATAFRGEVAGLPVEEYEYLVSRVAGTPRPVVRAATRYLEHALRDAWERVRCARPRAAVDDWRHDATLGDGSAVWTRRGEVFAVLAAGNHPAVHGPWLEALALGYRVAVRPSRREPFTAHRLVTVLREAGFGADRVALLPTDHTVADTLVEVADLSMVYGGEDVMRKYGTHPKVLPQGPGRSKILLTAADDWRTHLDTVVASVAREGGTACTNTSVVLVEGDPAPVAEALAERLAALPSLPPEHGDAVLPVHDRATAGRIGALHRHHLGGARPWLGGDGVTAELGDGSVVLRPAVAQLDRPDAPQTRVELGFPCAWVAPWSQADGVAPLRDTLVLTVSTRDDELLRRLVDEPSIANVYVGDQPTVRIEPHLPHDAYLPEFLMRTKAVIR